MYLAILSLSTAIASVVAMAFYGVKFGVAGGMIAIAVAIGLALDHERDKRRAADKQSPSSQSPSS